MYPMTVVSQMAHLVMKMQQDVADLVIKGDETLENLFPPKDEQPEWATFDEDLTDDDADDAAARRTATAPPDRGPVRAVLVPDAAGARRPARPDGRSRAAG